MGSPRHLSPSPIPAKWPKPSRPPQGPGPCKRSAQAPVTGELQEESPLGPRACSWEVLTEYLLTD